MRFLPTLFEGAAALPETKDAASRRASSGGPAYVFGRQAYRSNWSVERAVRDAYERVIWVYRAIDAIASAASRLNVVFREGHPETGEDVDPRDEPLWKVLNRRANHYESAQSFRYRLSTQLLLSKQGVFVEVVRSRGGHVTALHLLPPHRTSPIPDPDSFVSGYEVMGSGYGSETEVVPAANVLWIRKPHPLDPYMGTTPLEAMGVTVDLDFYARLYNRTFMQNDGRPGGILNVKGYFSPEDGEEIRRRFMGGPQSSGRVSVLEADDVSFVDTAVTPRDAQYVQTLDLTKETVLMGFGVPESIIGNASGRTFDNADAEEENFWRQTMAPHMDLIDAAFDSLTEGGIEDDRFVVHDVSGVAVLGRDERANEARRMAEFAAGLITLDEYREFTGKEAFDLPKTRALWVPAGLQTVATSEEDAAEITREAVEAQQAMAPVMQPRAPEDEGASDDRADARAAWQMERAERGEKQAPRPADASADYSAGVMVCFRVPEDLALEVALREPGALGPDELHLTLAFMGDVGSLDFTREQLVQAVASFAAAAPPLTGKVSGVGRFSTPEGTATYASVDSPELPAWRQRLVATLEAHGLTPSTAHGFTPHVTLHYARHEGETPAADSVPDLTLRFGTVEVTWGEDRTSFALRGEKSAARGLGHLRVV